MMSLCSSEYLFSGVGTATYFHSFVSLSFSLTSCLLTICRKCETLRMLIPAPAMGVENSLLVYMRAGGETSQVSPLAALVCNRIK